MTSAPRSGRLRAALLRLALLAATLSLLLGALELGLRIFWGGFYVKVPRGYAQSHPVRGWSNRPGLSVPYGEPEFNTTVTHNRFGYRSRAIEPERTPGRVRLLVLGDSFAYGVGVENQQTFSAQLESLAPQLEVINTGVNGYGTGQELLLLRDEGLAFRPDIVLVAFFWNDVGNSFKNPRVNFALTDGVLRYPTAAPTSDGSVAAKPRPADGGGAGAAPAPERREWLRYSYAYRYLSDRQKLLGYWLKVVLGLPLEESDMVSEEEREKAWALELALLREIDRVAREGGARTLLLVIPDQVQVEEGLRVTGLGAEDYQVQERLHAFADEAGIAVVDPLPALREARAQRSAPLYYLRDRHLVPDGQALLAREILARLEQLGWAQPGAARADASSGR